MPREEEDAFTHVHIFPLCTKLLFTFTLKGGALTQFTFTYYVFGVLSGSGTQALCAR